MLTRFWPRLRSRLRPAPAAQPRLSREELRVAANARIRVVTEAFEIVWAEQQRILEQERSARG